MRLIEKLYFNDDVFLVTHVSVGDSDPGVPRLVAFVPYHGAYANKYCLGVADANLPFPRYLLNGTAMTTDGTLYNGYPVYRCSPYVMWYGADGWTLSTDVACGILEYWLPENQDVIEGAGQWHGDAWRTAIVSYNPLSGWRGRGSKRGTAWGSYVTDTDIAITEASFHGWVKSDSRPDLVVGQYIGVGDYATAKKLVVGLRVFTDASKKEYVQSGSRRTVRNFSRFDYGAAIFTYVRNKFTGWVIGEYGSASGWWQSATEPNIDAPVTFERKWSAPDPQTDPPTTDPTPDAIVLTFKSVVKGGDDSEVVRFDTRSYYGE